MNSNLKGWILVGIQFICLGLLFAWPFTSPYSFSGKGFFYTGLILGIWAVIAMPPASLTVHPKPKSTGRLAFKGPYRIIRHPMYAAVLMVAIGQCVDYPDLKNIMALVCLATVLALKINMEEKYLSAKYPDFISYQKKSYKLIPFIW
jgi:protein-S-isoprenylcysteine O-methyltransferase Ste14